MSNNNPCKLYAARTEVSGEAVWRHRMQENPSAAGAALRTQLGELTALPSPFSWWGGVAALPQEPHPALSPSGLASPVPPLQNCATQCPHLVQAGDALDYKYSTMMMMMMTMINF